MRQIFQKAMTAKMEEMNQQQYTFSEQWDRESKSLFHAALDKFG